MRILNIGANALVPALRAQGETVYTVGLSETHDICVKHSYYTHKLYECLRSRGFEPDVLFYCDEGNLPLLIDPENIPIPSVWFSIDSYCNPWHVSYANGFDATLVAQKNFVRLFADYGVQAQWFPLFCAQSLIDASDPDSERDVPVSFVGTLHHKNNPDRAPFLEAFRRQQVIVIRHGSFAPLFRRSRIVLNQTAFSEVNFRCFEAMGCGAALLMESCSNGFSELFTVGEELLPTFPRSDAHSAAEIAKKALAAPATLARIARQGFDAVTKRHSDRVRAKTLRTLLTDLLHTKPDERRRTTEHERRTQLVRAAFGIIAADLEGPAMSHLVHFFSELARGHHPKDPQPPRHE